MSNIFILVLMILTCITGFFWFFKRIPFFLRCYCFLMKKIFKKQSMLDYKNNISIINYSYKLGWFENCASVFPILLLVFIIRSFIFEPFRIPSGSMMPTLLSGDFILVKKFSYGIKNPFTQKTIIKIGTPKRGDIVVFKYPLNPKLNYIKRIIGLPNDIISYDSINKKLEIYSNCNDGQNSIAIVPITYSRYIPSNFVQTTCINSNGKSAKSFFQVSSNIRLSNDSIRLMQSKETLNNISYDILITPEQRDQLEMYYQQSFNEITEWFVPPGEYFVMGDNRDNSADSRYWGFVPEKNLIGKAIAIWMSIDKEDGKWPTGIRLKRIGNIH